MKKQRFFSFLLALLLLVCGCVPSLPEAASSDAAVPPQISEDTVTFTDALGRELSLARPTRVAASIGSFADIWILAGGRDTLVATAGDAWTSFDLNLNDSVANLGSVKEPNFETLLASEPDLVLASTNTAANLEWQKPLEQAGIAVAYFDVEHFSDYLDMLAICTKLTGCPDHYTRFGTEVAAQVAAAIDRADGSAPTVLCLRASGSSCKAKGSEGNVLGEMLADLGCVNIADQDGALLETLSLEAIIAADPDYIFAVLQGADKSEAEQLLSDTLLANPAWSRLSAVQADRFYILDSSLYNLKPNAHWGDAYENLADILYPKTTE